MLTRFVSLLAASLLSVSSALAQGAPSKWLSAATTNSTLARTGPVILSSLVVINTTATLYYLKLYNKATAPTCGTDTPRWTVPIPASATGNGVSIPLGPAGLMFPLGLGFCLTGAIADNDVTVAATGVAINMGLGLR